MSTPTPDHKDDPNTIHHPPGVAGNEEDDSAARQDSASPAEEAPAKRATATPAPITHPGG